MERLRTEMLVGVRSVVASVVVRWCDIRERVNWSPGEGEKGGGALWISSLGDSVGVLLTGRGSPGLGHV